MNRWFLGVLALLLGTMGTIRAANPVVVMETSKGTIKIELFEDKAPVTVKNFLQYTDDKFYDGVIFHRVISDFMIQGGGFDRGYREKKTKAPITNESSNGVSNVRGTISMARTSNPNSATAQFFINVADNVRLNGNDARPGYAAFGNVIEGMDVVDKIRSVTTATKRLTDGRGETGEHENVPVEDVVILSVRRAN